MTILKDIQLDVYMPEILYDDGSPEGVALPPMGPSKTNASDEALVACLNAIGRVDLALMSESSGLSADTLVSELRGKAIFQDPEFFRDRSDWDSMTGWIPAPRYLSGNIVSKYQTAKEMEKRFPGCFEANLMSLERLLPERLDLSQIHVSLGAPWIPADIYAEFIKDLLQLRAKPEVFFNKQLSRWELERVFTYNSVVRNKITYGTSRLGASEIIEATMNARSVKVYDRIEPRSYRPNDRPRYVLNRAETLEAQNKQREILAEFEKWVMDPGKPRRIEKLQEAYNSAYVGYTYTPFDGSFLKLPGLNPDVHLFDHQRNAVARILMSGTNVLLAHDVGTGKTYEMIVAAHELKRMGLSAKNLFVVPCNVLQDFEKAHRLLYPDDDILVISPKRDFVPAKRDDALRKIRDGNYVAIYMAYSSFDMLRMSTSYYVNERRARIAELQQAVANASHTTERSSLKRAVEAEQKRLAKYESTAEDTPWMSFDELGIETLFLDEAHNYKNVSVPSSTDNIVGMHSGGSKKCDEMFAKTRNVKRLVFATGTPLTNSLSDLFVLQDYLQHDEIATRGIGDFDMWINTFGERETNVEIDVTANSLRTVTRFSSFHNLTELMGIFSTVCDFHKTDENAEELPHCDGPENRVNRMTPAQSAYIKWLSARAEAVRNPKTRVARKDDNLLKITTDGRKCAVDIRLVNLEDSGITLAPEDRKQTKIHACALHVRELYEAYPGTCQLVFSDLGTPKSAFNVYDALRDELKTLGIPAGEIAFVHDAQSETARARLFARMNRGELRVVIGSTEKLGIGVNVQERLIAIHHLSVPWRPSDMVQREGRLIRRGNTCENVFVCRYVTEGSFDGYSWQLLENKQRFISNFLGGISCDRTQADISDTVLSYAEIKGLAIGNPLVRRRVETKNRLDRTRNDLRHRQAEMANLDNLILDTPGKIKDLQEKIRMAGYDHDVYVSEPATVSKTERQAFGEELLRALEGNVLHASERRFDTYKGFDVMLPAAMISDEPYVNLVGPSGARYRVSMEDAKELGCLARIDNVLRNLPNHVKALHEQIRTAKRQREEAKAELAKGNRYEAVLEKLTGELADLDRQIEASEKSAS